MIPQEIQNLINRLASLPSIGPRQATRLAFYLLASDTGSNIARLSEALLEMQNIRQCDICFFYFSQQSGKEQKSKSLCTVCGDKERDKTTVCIVEKETNMISIEKGRAYEGIYLILGGHLNESKDSAGVKRARKRLEHLKKYIKEELGGKAEEIILALNPTSEGDLTALYLKKELSPLSKKISRLGRGIPTGGDIEFADEQTLDEAFKNRR